MLVQTYLGPKKALFQKIFIPKKVGTKKFWSNKILIKKRSWSEKAMVQKNVGPQNIEPKVDKNRVSSGLDTLDMDKCCLENFTVTVTIC